MNSWEEYETLSNTSVTISNRSHSNNGYEIAIMEWIGKYVIVFTQEGESYGRIKATKND